jgi:hypothetical protein
MIWERDLEGVRIESRTGVGTTGPHDSRLLRVQQLAKVDKCHDAGVVVLGEEMLGVAGCVFDGVEVDVAVVADRDGEKFLDSDLVLGVVEPEVGKETGRKETWENDSLHSAVVTWVRAGVGRSVNKGQKKGRAHHRVVEGCDQQRRRRCVGTEAEISHRLGG